MFSLSVHERNISAHLEEVTREKERKESLPAHFAAVAETPNIAIADVVVALAANSGDFFSLNLHPADAC